MKKAVVTGANGFIGSAVCRELSDRGMEVIAVIRDENEKTGMIEGIAGLRMVRCALQDFRKLHEIIKDENIGIFYHFAWTGSSGSLRSDENVQIDNIRYTLDAVKACADMHCPRFVFAASIMEYEVQASMQTEQRQSISSLYAIAKMSCDYMARVLAEKSGLDYIRCVISNIYGPGETSPRFMNTSLRKILKGEHCSFSAGEQMYDFIYISDACRAIVEAGGKGTAGRTYYIGSLNPRPLKEFLAEIREAAGVDADIAIGEIPFSGVSLTYNEFDIEAVKNDTGFVPEVTFSNGIQKTMEWIKESDGTDCF